MTAHYLIHAHMLDDDFGTADVTAIDDLDDFIACNDLEDDDAAALRGLGLGHAYSGGGGAAGGWTIVHARECAFDAWAWIRMAAHAHSETPTSPARYLIGTFGRLWHGLGPDAARLAQRGLEFAARANGAEIVTESTRDCTDTLVLAQWSPEHATRACRFWLAVRGLAVGLLTDERPDDPEGAYRDFIAKHGDALAAAFELDEPAAAAVIAAHRGDEAPAAGPRADGDDVVVTVNRGGTRG